MATNRGFTFVNEGIYHVFNRGVERRPVFTNSKEYQRFMQTIWYYQYPHQIRLSYYFALSNQERLVRQNNTSIMNENKLVCLLSYCLMPNHFHLIIKQNAEAGISSFIANVTNSYTKYFNTKHKRPGSLFQGPFKAVRVETDEQLIHLIRYIDLNPLVAGIARLQNLLIYPWSSLKDYITQSKSICDTSWLQSHFLTPETYIQFLTDQIEYAQKLESIKHLSLEETS